MAPDRSRDDGFTLVELLVVIVIIGILSSIAIPALAAQTRKGKVAELRSTLKNAATAEEERVTDDLPYATPDATGVGQLEAQGLRVNDDVVLTVVDDQMTAAGRGFCLRAHHTQLPVTSDLFYASSGPDAGRPTSTECVAS
jgi:prepilin-type N-terminal cleavage/methylation domain-containing protein